MYPNTLVREEDQTQTSSIPAPSSLISLTAPVWQVVAHPFAEKPWSGPVPLSKNTAIESSPHPGRDHTPCAVELSTSTQASCEKSWVASAHSNNMNSVVLLWRARTRIPEPAGNAPDAPKATTS